MRSLATVNAILSETHRRTLPHIDFTHVEKYYFKVFEIFS